MNDGGFIDMINSFFGGAVTGFLPRAVSGYA